MTLSVEHLKALAMAANPRYGLARQALDLLGTVHTDHEEAAGVLDQVRGLLEQLIDELLPGEDPPPGTHRLAVVPTAPRRGGRGTGRGRGRLDVTPTGPGGAA